MRRNTTFFLSSRQPMLYVDFICYSYESWLIVIQVITDLDSSVAFEALYFHAAIYAYDYRQESDSDLDEDAVCCGALLLSLLL